MLKKIQVHCQKADRCKKFDGSSCPRETYPNVNYLCFDSHNLYVDCQSKSEIKKNRRK